MSWRAGRAFLRRHRLALTVLVAGASTALLLLLLYGRREEFSTAISSAALWVIGLAIVLQVLGLLARTEAWHHTITAAGGTVPRRALYRASSMQVLGSVANPHLGVAARIAALRRSSPELSPQVPTLIAAELPIAAVEAALATLTSFTLIGPLGLPWWLPLVGIAGIVLASTALRRLALGKGRELWRGLAVVRTSRDGSVLVGLVLLAVLAQVLRNWLLLHAVGVDASFSDAIAVLIAVVTLGQLPIGPSVGAAAAVLILGHDGVAATAAAGILLTATGTAGGLCFAAWAGGDHAWARLLRAGARTTAPPPGPATPPR
ncbi:MAG TPA: lysylphosphatidylglycerol synthase domain-containing protein [Conexibacter sp.]